MGSRRQWVGLVGFFYLILVEEVDRSCRVELTLTDVILWQSGEGDKGFQGPIHNRGTNDLGTAEHLLTYNLYYKGC